GGRSGERRAAEAGPGPPGERGQQRRDGRLSQSFDRTWVLEGNYGPMQGTAMQEILQQYVQAETLADWEKARAEHGDTATAGDLPRSDAQRRADALWQIFQDAATNPNSPVPVGFCHNIVWSHDTYFEMARRFDGHKPQPIDPDLHRCETLDGVQLDPTEAFANSIENKVRRVVTGAKSAVIDLGVARGFTGAARLAVQLDSDTCIWPGCAAPTTGCDVDHLHEHAKGGTTNPANGAMMCSRHNRFKHNKRIRVWRDPSGEWHLQHPNGTPIT
ncbi:MAG: HNH endonuclease signature motif containing protein, partial [Myxococcota bacterium]